MDTLYIGFFIILAGVILARMVYNNALKSLSADKKAELVDMYGGRNVRSLIFIGVFLLLYFLTSRYELVDPFIAFPIFIIVMLAFIVRNGLAVRNKLKQSGFPNAFIKGYLLSFTIRIVSLLVFMIFIMRDMASQS
ncbi:hypothetical protein AB9P05_13915 [Roseivirga sp. BDSF3-8]|uniref:hypothetical protein n=1 Tax=Roseivirga sp. BDSF3-8 TaxID=3241598 RepID=UPI003531AEAA